MKEKVYDVICSAKFMRDWQKFNYTEDDLKRMKRSLQSDPLQGEPMKDSGGLLKYVLPNGNDGRHGWIRVGYKPFGKFGLIYCVVVYKKSKKENLSIGERNEIAKMLRKVEADLKGGLMICEPTKKITNKGRNKLKS